MKNRAYFLYLMHCNFFKKISQHSDVISYRLANFSFVSSYHRHVHDTFIVIVLHWRLMFFYILFYYLHDGMMI